MLPVDVYKRQVSILPILKEPQNQNGQLKYNIAGMTFAKEKSGSEYILLEDDSIGYWGSEGKVCLLYTSHSCCPQKSDDTFYGTSTDPVR